VAALSDNFVRSTVDDLGTGGGMRGTVERAVSQRAIEAATVGPALAEVLHTDRAANYGHLG
jgi:hypothetical protein